MGVQKSYNVFTEKWELNGWGVHWTFDTEEEADAKHGEANRICFAALKARKAFFGYFLGI